MGGTVKTARCRRGLRHGAGPLRAINVTSDASPVRQSLALRLAPINLRILAIVAQIYLQGKSEVADLSHPPGPQAVAEAML